MGDVAKENEKSMFDDVGDSISGMFSSTSDAITENKIVKDTGEIISNTASSVKNTLSSVSVQDTRDVIMESLSDSTSVLFLIIILLVISLIIGYIIYYIVTDSVLYQSKLMINGTDVPLFCNKLTKHDILQKLENGNGQKRSYAFWIYIFNAPDQSIIRHIAHISDEESTEKHQNVKNSSPYIVLNPTDGYNNIGVRIPFKDGGDDYSAAGGEAFDHSEVHTNTATASYFQIEYVPVQRWVHIAFVISDIAGGSITTYIDGNLNKVILNDGKTPLANLDKIHNFKLDHKGVLCVGGNSDATTYPIGFEGLLSKFTMWNYDINKNDVYKDYRAGPLNGILASMGIGAYGLRNPIYKLEAANVQE